MRWQAPPTAQVLLATVGGFGGNPASWLSLGAAQPGVTMFPRPTLSLTRALILLGLSLGGLSIARARTPASAWTQADVGPALALSESVDAGLADGDALQLSVLGVAPDSSLLLGEWALATYMMAAIGHAQLGLAHPELQPLMAQRSSRAVDALLDPTVWDFDTAVWGDAALQTLDDDRHDHAVLGYAGFALGMERLVDPDNRHVAIEEAVARALSRRLEHTLVLQTYPGQSYPVDHAMAIAAVALHARAVGQPRPSWLKAHIQAYTEHFVDGRGLLVQSVSPGSGRARGQGRGSGTALAAWALAWADPEFSRQLSTAVKEELGATVRGQVVALEYPPAICQGWACSGDVDSGPLIEGASVSATGFSLASALRLQDAEWFSGLWATTRLFGGWTGRRFATGGDLGNAIMLAMLTAPPVPPLLPPPLPPPLPVEEDR